MVDDFMVCVDRIIATACFDRATRGQEQLHEEHQNSDNNNNHHHHHHYHSSVSVNNETVTVKNNTTNKKGEMLECRICQEEDEVNSMESPCACNGTLKFAHRKCIQRWCNKKGDITCEICNQVFSPNYLLPPRSNPDVMTIDIRQAWGPHIDLRDSHFLALAAAERQFLQSEYDEYAVANSGSIACLRSVALILLVILLVRQVLMVTRDAGMVQASSAFFHFQILLLQCAGFLLPCYVMARSWYIMQSRRRRQVFFKVLIMLFILGWSIHMVVVGAINMKIYVLIFFSDR